MKIELGSGYQQKGEDFQVLLNLNQYNIHPQNLAPRQSGDKVVLPLASL
jgi:hypothetical protein